MSFKLKNPYPDNTVPVFKVPMEDEVFGKANNEASSSSGFNIHINQNINDTPTVMKVIEHENMHINQMAKGDMDYDDEFVYWKGQKIPRANMPEGAHDLPWEKEVYDKTDVDMSFKMREGSGNYPAFANLSGRQLIKSANAMASPLHNGHVPTGSEIPYSGSKKALQQKTELEKLGKEKEVKLNSNDPGYNDPDLGIKKHTSFYKASTEEQKKKGNEYWSGLSEPEKQAIRDKKSRYTKEPIKIVPRGPEPIPNTPPTLRKITKVPDTPLETPKPKTRERIKSKKDIKRETLSQYGGTYDFKGKPVMSVSAQKHYDEQLALRKEKKHANRKTNKFLSRNKKTKDYRDEYNVPGNTKVTTTSTTTTEAVGSMQKPIKGYVYIKRSRR